MTKLILPTVSAPAVLLNANGTPVRTPVAPAPEASGEIINRLADGTAVKVRTRKIKAGSKRARAVAVMFANADRPASEVITLIAAASEIPLNSAKGYYRYLSAEGYAPGDGTSGNFPRVNLAKTA